MKKWRCSEVNSKPKVKGVCRGRKNWIWNLGKICIGTPVVKRILYLGLNISIRKLNQVILYYLYIEF